MAVKKYVVWLKNQVKASNDRHTPVQASEFGQGPPIRNYEHLKHVSEFAPIPQSFALVSTKAELVEASAKWKESKQAFVEMIAMLKQATKKLSTAIAKAQKQASERIAGPGQTQAQTKGAAAASTMVAKIALLFEAAADYLPAAKRFELEKAEGGSWCVKDSDKDEAMQAQSPLVLSISADAFRKDFALVVDAATALIFKFKKSPEYKTTKREARKMVDATLAQAASLFKNVLQSDADSKTLGGKHDSYPY